MTFPPKLIERIRDLSKVKQTSVSLKQMVQFGRNPSPDTLFKGAQFILHELPIRLAHRVVELENLPHDLSKMPGVLTVKDWYTQSTLELLEFAENRNGIPTKFREGSLQNYYNPSETQDYKDQFLAYNKEFIQCIDKIKKRHSPTTTTIASGVIQVKEYWKMTNSPLAPQGERLPLPTASI